MWDREEDILPRYVRFHEDQGLNRPNLILMKKTRTPSLKDDEDEIFSGGKALRKMEEANCINFETVYTLQCVQWQSMRAQTVFASAPFFLLVSAKSFVSFSRSWSVIRTSTNTFLSSWTFLRGRGNKVSLKLN